MKIPRSVIRRINRDFSMISHSVSGGMDSLYSLLKLIDDPYLKIPIEPQFINTGVNQKSSKKVISMIDQLSPGKRLLPTRTISYNSTADQRSRYYGFTPIEIVRDSFKYIPKAENLLLEGKYSKKVFPCCYYLKEKALHQFARSTPEDVLFTSSIRGGESMQRQLTLSKYRKNGTYFHFNKKLQRWVFYPLRDTNFDVVREYLLKHKIFWNTKHSGCVICPVLKLFSIDS